MPRKWTSKEQEEFLTSMLGEFRMRATEKKYEEFWKKVNKLFFEKWPERRACFGDLPADHVLTPDQVKDLASAVESREEQLATWYRWRKNPAHLGRTSGVKGALKFDAVLAGGVELKGTRAPQKMDIYSYKYYGEKVKDTADAEIRAQNVTDRGPKLNKRREVTRRLYSEECEDVKNKVERRYQKAKAKYAKARLRQKSGKMPRNDDATKIKAIRELGPMLDRILKYLAHATGGWKFTILMGGKDPSTGEVSVFNYHIGELESGAQFDQTYANFDAVQGAFLAFVKDALAFESTLPQDSDAEEAEDSSSDSHDGSDEEWATTSGSEHGGCHVEEEDLDDLLPNSAHRINTAGMYWMTPQSESSIEDDFGAAIASTDASLPCARVLGDASSGSQLPSDSHLASFNNPPNLPVFDHEVFTALINDLNFNISILDALPEAPPFNSIHILKSLSLQLLALMMHHLHNILKFLSLRLLALMIHHPSNIPKSSSLQLLALMMRLLTPMMHHLLNIPKSLSLQLRLLTPMMHHLLNIPKSLSLQLLWLLPLMMHHLPNICKSLSLQPLPLMMHHLPNILKSLSLRLLVPMLKIWEHPMNLMVLAQHQLQQSKLELSVVVEDEIQPLPDGHRRVRKPFNARERDNDIGGPTKHARHT
ncbi:uncharacterized protein HD556DRAFT_1304834 [Suillus plorans]|uniref:Uncharacterized protein n=1 Tax=Suillus plorans TaxID=116603 RepID=A0A9P7J342_9AGAM|nr:uncharacterized protein HD556DRAFT_1304834 [Suillus plorans]KAG1800843.1 hypothetical protein HD556DRAFT_1304834 [Suillus plorans]